MIIHDNTHLKLTQNATFHLTDGANCSNLDNDGLYSRKTNYNITIEGGIWDGNNVAQQREYIEDENLPYCPYQRKRGHPEFTASKYRK